MAAKEKRVTRKDVEEALCVDQVQVVLGKIFTVRRGFYYTHGFTAEKLVEQVKCAYPHATILDSGEIWKPFKGGASVARQSHWFVKFTL